MRVQLDFLKTLNISKTAMAIEIDILQIIRTSVNSIFYIMREKFLQNIVKLIPEFFNWHGAFLWVRFNDAISVNKTGNIFRRLGGPNQMNRTRFAVLMRDHRQKLITFNLRNVIKTRHDGLYLLDHKIFYQI